MSLAERTFALEGKDFSLAIDAFERCRTEPRKGVLAFTAGGPGLRTVRFELKIAWEDPILFRFGSKWEALEHKDAVAKAILGDVEAQVGAAGAGVRYFFFLLAGSEEKGSLIYWDEARSKDGWTIARSTIDA